MLGSVLDFLFPPRCAFCCSPGALLCRRCEDILPRNTPCCERCANPLESRQPGGVDCADCQDKAPPFAAAIAPFLYEFPVDTAIKALKFRRQLFYAPVFGKLLADVVQSEFPDIDGLVPVPLHRWRFATRGFNQAWELCRAIRRVTGVPIATNVSRVRATKTQSGLSAAERRRNLRGAFAVSGKLKLRRPLIVDDVMTTGQTCFALSRCLLNAGAEAVFVLTIARAK